MPVKKKAPRRIAITLQRSLIGCPDNQRRIARGLGLRRLRQTVIHPDRPEVRGMTTKLRHLVEVRQVQEDSSETS